MRVAVELVPRDAAALASQLEELSNLSAVETVNVPDLAHFAWRSWEAALAVTASDGCRWRCVPHVRAMDVDVTAPWRPLARLASAGIDELLVVTGDLTPDMGHQVTGASAIAVIRALKAADPRLKVYAALDPYRAGFAAELDYARRKLEAGADGFFTQPFFDLRLMSVWRELMPGVTVFWGVTSVTSERSKRYWLTRNRAVFPAGFEPTLAWHQRFAADTLEFAARFDADVYFMPIRVGIREWLGELLK